jgi:hypothetical protein
MARPQDWISDESPSHFRMFVAGFLARLQAESRPVEVEAVHDIPLKASQTWGEWFGVGFGGADTVIYTLFNDVEANYHRLEFKGETGEYVCAVFRVGVPF